MTDKPPLIELEIVRDTFITGIGDIQILGHNARIILYVEQGGSGGSPVERIVVTKLLVTLDSIPSGILDVIRATGRGISQALFAEITEAERVGRH